MKNSEKENWLINIENTALEVAEIYGADTVSFIYNKYGATNAESLSPSDYDAVFGELYQMAVDN